MLREDFEQLVNIIKFSDAKLYYNVENLYSNLNSKDENKNENEALKTHISESLANLERSIILILKLINSSLLSIFEKTLEFYKTMSESYLESHSRSLNKITRLLPQQIIGEITETNIVKNLHK